MTILSIDPRIGRPVEAVAKETGPADVSALVEAAAKAAPGLDAMGRAGRAALLRAMANQLEARRAAIVELGVRETALPEPRLHGELTRTAYQARLFADVLEEGSYLEAAIDHAGETPMGPGPDLRRLLTPIGPVAVFGASNFPLAFSVPGGDTISALAAGCPVVVKAHDSHSALSLLTFETLTAAAESVDAPAGTVGLVFGQQGGAELVAHPGIKAVGFTGSLEGGKALLDIIRARPEPIPFYGELSSINPVVVTAGAVAARATELAEGFVASITGSGGQLCTKPGVVFVPIGADGDKFVRAAAALVSDTAAVTMLNGRISASYESTQHALRLRGPVRVVAEGGKATGDGFEVTATLLEVAVRELGTAELQECFGPTALVARYDSGELDAALDVLPGSLTVTIHAEPDETDAVRHLTDVLRPKAGRLLFAGWPTGVLVSWAQHHGGPWPSTNTLHTSVGSTAIRRFLRPVTWQSAPEALLPDELRDGYTGIPRRVDGVLRTATT